MAVSSVGEKKKNLDCDNTSSKAFLTEPTLSLERSKLGKFILFDRETQMERGKGKREKGKGKKGIVLPKILFLDSIRFHDLLE